MFLNGSDTPLAENAKVYKDDVLTIKGSGFDPESNKTSRPGVVPAGASAGHYVVFGKYASSWRPSENAPKGNRAGGPQKWAMTSAVLESITNPQYQDVVKKDWAELKTDGTWTADIKLAAAADAEKIVGGSYGVYTSAAGGAVNASQELAFTLDYQDSERVSGGDNEEPGTGGNVKGAGTLQWGVKKDFYNYVSGNGSVKTDGKIATEKNKVFSFPQQTGGKWDDKKMVGEARYAGYVQFTAHNGALDLIIQNPTITVINANKAQLSAETGGGKNASVRTIIADITLSKPEIGAKGDVTWKAVPAVLNAAGEDMFAGFYVAGEPMDPVTFTVGNGENIKPTTPPKPVVKPTPKPKPKPIVVPSGTEKQPGSLTWGISSGFAGYTTGKAKGSITSDGVGRSGGAYLFPQASNNWNAATQTGTVQFSGVVTFTGHKGAMVENFSNPVITVNSATSATMYAGGRPFSLDLGSASKVVGPNGEVTWNGVPVGGGISGGGSAGGGSGGGTFSADPLSFTVGAANSANYGSTEQTAPSTKRTAADTPPATTGIKLITDKKKLIPGAEIEFEATGFEPNERDILVVLYSDPIVLDDAAGADENGVVRWIGNLPKDLKPGEHTLTLQGSKNAGVVMTVLSKEQAKAKAKAELTAEPMTAQSGMSAKAESGNLADTGSQLWIWWTAAIVLLVLAVIGAALVVRQRRTIE